MISISELFISNAYAEGAAPAPQGGGFMEFLPLIALLAVFYFLILRPQQKRAKEHKALMEALQKGDEVVTIGGMFGTVTGIGDDWVELEVAKRTRVRYLKRAISSITSIDEYDDDEDEYIESADDELVEDAEYEEAAEEEVAEEQTTAEETQEAVEETPESPKPPEAPKA